MSTIQNSQESWTKLADHQLDPKYEKCRNITEEIYKRINITFQIKKLETGDQSDVSVNSDQIDSNELSNETDLFACDKSDISSSTDPEQKSRVATCPPVNINNNNDERGKVPVCKRPKKRFRKRVKKRPPNRKRSDSEGSSDEAPLSRSLLILSPELKPKSPEKKPLKKSPSKNLLLRELLKPTDIKVPTVLIEKIKSIDKEAMKKESIDKKSPDKKNPIIDNIDRILEKTAEKHPMAVDKKTEDVIPTTKEKISTGKIEKVSAIDKLQKDEDVPVDKKSLEIVKKKGTKDVTEWKSCSLCTSSFRGERGLRRHMSMSHIVSPEN